MYTWLLLKLIEGVIQGRENPICNKTFVWIDRVIFDLVRMTHHHGFSIVLFDLVVILHLVHADDLPIMTWPQNSMEWTQKYFYVVFLTGHKSSIWICTTNPSINFGSEFQLRLVPLIFYLFLSLKILLHMLLYWNLRFLLWSGLLIKIWLWFLLCRCTKIKVT